MKFGIHEVWQSVVSIDEVWQSVVGITNDKLHNDKGFNLGPKV